MSLNWVDCDLPAPQERTPEQIRKSPSAASPAGSQVAHSHWSLSLSPLCRTVATFQYSMTKEVMWPLIELMESTSPSSYSAVQELDKKIRELSAAINIHEDEQFNSTAATLEWNCILGACVRQSGGCHSLRFYSLPECLAISVSDTKSPYMCAVESALFTSLIPSLRSQLQYGGMILLN